MNEERFAWWNNLRHGGLLLDSQRLAAIIPQDPEPLRSYEQDRLRRKLQRFRDDEHAHRGELVSQVLESVCGFNSSVGHWSRAGDVSSSWSRKAITGESVRPRHLWQGLYGATLPVFIDDQPRLGVGRGQRIISQTLQWLRQGKEQLALVTNGQQWRLLFAGLDYEAFCEWDIALWLTEGDISPELNGFRSLVSPTLWTPPKKYDLPPLLAAINDSRKGQSDLSQILGERVRESVEKLVQGHGPALAELPDTVSPQDIYRAGVRVIMRMVVTLFAESREGLLPRDNPIFHGSYSHQGLREQLERTAPHRLRGNYAAWFRVLAMFRLIHQGSSHEALPVPSYGGELFAPGDATATDGMQQALAVLESACFERDLMSDAQVREILVLLTRTKVRLRQGRSSTWTSMPVDFSSLDSEYIGILYEGLLDFELKTAPSDQPVVFLALGNQPALPLATLEAMDDKSIKNLLEKMKDTSSSDDEEEGEDAGDEEAEEATDDDATDESTDEADEGDDSEPNEESDSEPDDVRHTTRARAEAWATRACEVGGLVRKPRGKMTAEKQLQYEAELSRKARQVIPRVVLPGEWYLIRWGGTRKGSGTFYTRPQLAIPTVHRTLRPLAYNPPVGKDGQADVDAPLEAWTPKLPEQILDIKVCDPACGSGTFPLAALRFLTQALYASLQHHGRIREAHGRAVLSLIQNTDATHTLAEESLPCRPDDDHFEPRTRAVLRRYVVERCIYGVDLDPLAVELCRLSLWIETLDRRLPFTFLDHKIKPGNALVGAWFDQFLHYPIMAWSREGGDKNHTNGVHFEKEAWTKAISEFNNQAKHDLKQFIDGGRLSFSMDLTQVQTGHDAAEKALREIHELGIAQVRERSEKYAALRSSSEFLKLKEAFDLWCSLWFWPPDQLEHAPQPGEFGAGKLSDEARAIVRQVAEQRRFFHWELEFPDVFSSTSHGFTAILGNPPWDISKPNSKEFFSAVDPLYRSYGKQEAVRQQTAEFERNAQVERRWLDYSAYFKGMSNWVKYAGAPFGNAISEDSKGKESFDCNLGDGGRNSFATSTRRHERWQLKREESSGYADEEHSFRHQGSADVNLYKLFLEQAHALLNDDGRLGLIVPSGLYSDHGTGDLRRLFVDHCQWEWLFGFENREGIFDIHRSFKFNPIVVTKGGQTQVIRTAFMRRQLADWERGEDFATSYTREQIVQFSPHSRAILEIQSERDLEVLTKIYANSVLLGDQSERGWGIKYTTEFHMTNDSKLFPPRPKWEEWGYRPDEYSRWIKGPWKPIAELWQELGIDPSEPVPIDDGCQQEIDDGVASGEVARTEWRIRCAQPPYDTLPIPRADVPAGVILSREADAWLREDEIPIVTFTEANGKPLKIKTGRGKNSLEVEPSGPAIAIPVFEGRMVGQLDFSQKGWVSGSGRSAVWREIEWGEKQIEPQYLMGFASFQESLLISHLEAIKSNFDESEFEAERERLSKRELREQWWAARKPRIGFMDVTSATNERTMIAAPSPECPFGNSAPVLATTAKPSVLAAILDSFSFDVVARARCCGLHLNWFVVAEAVLPPIQFADLPELATLANSVTLGSSQFAAQWRASLQSWRSCWALTDSARLRIRCQLESIVGAILGLTVEDVGYILSHTDYPVELATSNTTTSRWPPKGFWRVDKPRSPEHRLTVLSLVAFHDLQQKIAECDGNIEQGVEAFCSQNDGEGWMLPETLRLADYGLGHDDRANEHQPVRECFGPRFYDWQLAQSADESWKECHLHARNLLGADGYQALLDELAGRTPEPTTAAPAPVKKKETAQRTLFD